MPDKNQRPGNADDQEAQNSAGSCSSPLPGKGAQHHPEIVFPFAPPTDHVIVSEHEQLHALLSSLPVMLFTLDRQATITMLEGRGVNLLAPSPHSLVGRSFFELYAENSETRGHVTKALNGTAVNWTGYLGDRIVETTLTPLRNCEDAVTGVLGIGIIASDNVPVVRSTETARQSASSAASRRNKLFAEVSHELRTPLNSIVGFADLLLKHGGSRFNEQEVFYLQRIAGNAAHLLGVVGEMMDLSLLETGRAKLSVTEVDLSGLIRETIAEIGRGPSPGAIELRTEIPDDARPVEADRQKLKQVLINLLSNALKYTRQGTVTVSIGVDEFHRPVRIDVRDTGMGIPAENLEAIFDAFERGEHAVGQDIVGMGLGLTISRALCRLLGYTIHVASEPGKGSTFTIDISHTPASQPR